MAVHVDCTRQPLGASLGVSARSSTARCMDEPRKGSALWALWRSASHPTPGLGCTLRATGQAPVRPGDWIVRADGRDERFPAGQQTSLPARWAAQVVALDSDGDPCFAIDGQPWSVYACFYTQAPSSVPRFCFADNRDVHDPRAVRDKSTGVLEWLQALDHPCCNAASSDLEGIETPSSDDDSQSWMLSDQQLAERLAMQVLGELTGGHGSDRSSTESSIQDIMMYQPQGQAAYGGVQNPGTVYTATPVLPAVYAPQQAVPQSVVPAMMVVGTPRAVCPTPPPLPPQAAPQQQAVPLSLASFSLQQQQMTPPSRHGSLSSHTSLSWGSHRHSNSTPVASLASQSGSTTSSSDRHGPPLVVAADAAQDTPQPATTDLMSFLKARGMQNHYGNLVRQNIDSSNRLRTASSEVLSAAGLSENEVRAVREPPAVLFGNRPPVAVAVASVAVAQVARQQLPTPPQQRAATPPGSPAKGEAPFVRRRHRATPTAPAAPQPQQQRVCDIWPEHVPECLVICLSVSGIEKHSAPLLRWCIADGLPAWRSENPSQMLKSQKGIWSAKLQGIGKLRTSIPHNGSAPPQCREWELQTAPHSPWVSTTVTFKPQINMAAKQSISSRSSELEPTADVSGSSWSVPEATEFPTLRCLTGASSTEAAAGTQPTPRASESTAPGRRRLALPLPICQVQKILQSGVPHPSMQATQMQKQMCSVAYRTAHQIKEEFSATSGFRAAFVKEITETNNRGEMQVHHIIHLLYAGRLASAAKRMFAQYYTRSLSSRRGARCFVRGLTKVVLYDGYRDARQISRFLQEAATSASAEVPHEAWPRR